MDADKKDYSKLVSYFCGMQKIAKDKKVTYPSDALELSSLTSYSSNIDHRTIHATSISLDDGPLDFQRTSVPIDYLQAPIDGKNMNLVHLILEW